MSWCRWGSKCQDTVPPTIQDDACPRETCPGSALYIFEHCNGTLVCFDCSLSPDGSDFEAGPTGAKGWDIDLESIPFATREAMARHLLEHDAVGHHVRRSLLVWARELLKA